MRNGMTAQTAAVGWEVGRLFSLIVELCAVTRHQESFQTPDLFEGRNLAQVALCLYSLGRATQRHPEYTGPALGTKLATRNERNFTEEQVCNAQCKKKVFKK